jgi:hypothetical protein
MFCGRWTGTFGSLCISGVESWQENSLHKGLHYIDSVKASITNNSVYLIYEFAPAYISVTAPAAGEIELQ